MKRVKYVNSCLILMFLVAGLFFCIVPVPLRIFLFALIVTNCFVLYRFGRKENRRLHKNLLFLELSVALGYVAGYCLRIAPDFSLLRRRITAAGRYWWLFVILAIEVIWMLKNAAAKREHSQTRRRRDLLFQEREDDLKRLGDLVESMPIAGINATWGEGKSFLIREFAREKKNMYSFIEMDFLTCNLGEFQTTLVKRIEDILHENGIYSGYVHELDFSVRDPRLLARIGEWFLSSMHLLARSERKEIVSALGKLRRKADALERPVVIIYEDLDRIKNEETIRMVLDMAERLSSKKLRFIIQYDGERMAQIGLERDYLEKYIPYEMTLTGIRLPDQIRALAPEAGMAEEAAEYVKELLRKPYFIPEFERICEVTSDTDPDLKNRRATVRMTRSFLSEAALEWKRYHKGSLECDTMLHLLYMKHFAYGEYQKLEYGRSVPECLTFADGDKEYTLAQLCAKKQDGSLSSDDIARILRQNKGLFYLIAQFDYAWDEFLPVEGAKKDSLISVETLRKREKNERIDRTIWNLIQRGTSEFSDMQAMVSKLQREVLSAPQKDQLARWEKLRADYVRDSNLYKDNETVFRVGNAPETSVFQAYRASDQGSAEWAKLLDFYFRVIHPETLEPKVTDTLCYCDFGKSKDLLIDCAKHFYDLSVTGNLNGVGSYWKFLSETVNNMALQGYGDLEYGILGSGESHKNPDTGFVTDYLGDCEQKIGVSQDQFSGGLAYVKECRVLRKFLDKNVEVIRTKEPVVCEPVAAAAVSHEKTRQNEEIFTALLQQKGEEGFTGKVDEAYRKGDITPRDLKELLS